MAEIMALWQKIPAEEASPGQRPTLALYPVAGSRGLVIICPGGGYEVLAPHEGEPVAKALNGMGIAAAVLTYRLRPCAHTAPLMDAQRAIRLGRSLGYQRVGILGFSAGGNLACNAATHGEPGQAEAADLMERFSSRPDALISCYSVVTMGRWTHEGSRRALLGAQADDEVLRDWYSAEKNVRPDTPPAFIWHTAEDGLVPPQNSLMLAEAMAAQGVPFTLHIYPHGPHGIGLAETVPEAAGWLREAATWLMTQGFGG